MRPRFGATLGVVEQGRHRGGERLQLRLEEEAIASNGVSPNPS